MQQINFNENVLLAVTDKSDGNIDPRFSTKNEVRQNRKKIFKELDLLASDVIEAQQIHGSRLLALNEENSKMWKGVNVTGVDGFVTDQDSIALMLRVADCSALVYYDPINVAIGVFHAGWKGVLDGIHLKGLQMMTEHYETEAKQLHVWVSPCARAAHYRMDQEPKQIQDPAWKPFIHKQKGFWHVDFSGFALEALRQKGVLKKHITDEGVCTIESPEYFSHFESKTNQSPEGRCAVILKLKQAKAKPKKETDEDNFELDE